MQIELIQRILPLDLGKTAKLCLLIMSAHFYKKQWFVSDLVEIIGGDAKTVRFALRDLNARGFVEIVGKTDLQANVFELREEKLLRLDLPVLGQGMRSALARLERQAQQRRPPRSKQPKPSRKA